jgi:murein DD-endopeptidase MepM/ murein hydrolase activator NlpD
MKKKNLSLLLIPHQGKMWSKRISYSKIYLAFLVLVLFMGAGAFSTVHYLKHQWDQYNFAKLEKEKEHLEKRISEMKPIIAELKSGMSQLMEKEKNIRLVFGLPEVDDAIREVGVGGPNPFPYVEESSIDLNGTVAQVDKLLRQTKFERENLDQIHNQLLEKRDLLQHTPSIAPTKGYLSRGFGVKTDPFTGLKQPHWGIDLAANIGTPVYATAAGKVHFTGWHYGLGKLVIIDHGYAYRTHYGHLNKIKVRKGQKVERGDVIGGVGNTGYSTGPHLHYEVHYQNKPVNPRDYILSENYIFD